MRVGSLFSGYGGLDMAVGGVLAWYSEIEPAACQVLTAHHPGAPNLGDITRVDWLDVSPVDVLTAGYPCQPFSTAGHRKGTNDDRHLWPHVRNAISALRPGTVVLENVRGHLTMGAPLVVGELAALGYDARWGVVRASDAGAPHGRARLFIVAHAQGSHAQEHERDRQGTRDTGRLELGNGNSPNWGKYEPAIRRWEALTRPAPTPTREGRLNPIFVEWMMGLPEGWVTGHGLSATKELKMLGNGVCPQQAKLALEILGMGK